jgi:hypothetical protein
VFVYALSEFVLLRIDASTWTTPIITRVMQLQIKLCRSLGLIKTPVVMILNSLILRVVRGALGGGIYNSLVVMKHESESQFKSPAQYVDIHDNWRGKLCMGVG